MSLLSKNINLPTEISRNETFPFSVEVEVDSSLLVHENVPTLEKYCNQGGFDNIYHVSSYDDPMVITEPHDQKSNNGVYVVAGYNDGSVPFELVLASHDPYELSHIVDKINEEIIETNKIGQHVSIQTNSSWYSGTKYFALQNLALALERSMLRYSNKKARSNSYWGYMGASRFDGYTEKYSAINVKGVNNKNFLEFRLHHAIPSAKVYFEFFPYIFNTISKQDLRVLSIIPNPMRDNKSYFITCKILEKYTPEEIMESLPLKMVR